MNIVQITPGAGGMYCGNCFRDNALVAELRRLGHSTLMVPLYLPMTLEEGDSSAGTPIFFGGISVYLEQQSRLFSKVPRWLHQLLASPRVLKWAAGRAAKTRPQDVGELTLSMLRGEDGRQARELEELVRWLKTQPPPDVIALSNGLLVGMARRMKAELRAPIVCTLQGEDSFLDLLPEKQRQLTWQTLADQAANVDLFIAPTQYFGERMRQRLGLAAERVRIVSNGINLEGFSPAEKPPDPPVLGYFARMCREKGLDILVAAFIELKQRNQIPNLKLRVGGGCGPGDEAFVAAQKALLEKHGFLADAQFFPNVDRAAKQDFFRHCSVFSVPALYGEAFGLYVIEALACAVPVVQPRQAAFPEIIEATGGGVLSESADPESLARAIEALLLDRERARALGEAGRRAVLQHFSVEHMARATLEAYQTVIKRTDLTPATK